MTRLTCLAALVVLCSAAASPAARDEYVNPTPGQQLALQIPGMHRASVRRDLVYRRVGGERLRMDVYRPRGAGSRRLPAVLLGGPHAFGAGRESGQKVGWAQAIAASGLAAVAFDIRADNFLRTPRPPSSDVAAALAYVRTNATRLGIDRDRLCTLGFSLGTAPWHVWAAMRGPDASVRCNAVFYGPLDFTGGGFDLEDALAAEYSALTYLRRDGASIAPMLVAKAGEDDPAINDAIDRFVAAAREVQAPVELVTHPRGIHAFDVRQRDARSKAIIRRTLAFFRERLLAGRSLAARPPPLRLAHTCVTRAERGRVVRFTTADGTRLIGVILGAGTKGVVLAHQGGGGAPGNLCAWIPYARQLAGRGYRVLAFDHRGRGSSGSARRVNDLHRVDRDVVAAVKELRRRGATSVVLAGASLGGSAVIAAGAEIQPPVQGVISLAAPETFVRVDALAAARRLTVPALFVAAEEDVDFPEQARRLYEATASADKRLAIFPGSEHGAPLLRRPEPRALVDEWIDAHSTLWFGATSGSSGWSRLEPGGRTACARGGRYAYWLRRGDPKRVVVFFQGGGGCFDVRSCAPGSTWFDDRVDRFDDPAAEGGILGLDDSRNPFRDWSFLYVPSCTGDVHLGDRVARYGSTVIRHRGWPNARAALARAFRDFPDPDVVLVTGCSAGSVGSAFHVPAVIERWPKARVTQLGDSLAFVFHRPITLADWGAPERFPAFFRIGSRRFTMSEYLRALARRYPRRTFARFNYASDDVQERFYAALGADPAGFEPRLRRVEEELKRLPNYRSYLACGGDHCVLPRESFFSLEVGGVAIGSWVERLAAGRNVGCPRCR